MPKNITWGALSFMLYFWLLVWQKNLFERCQKKPGHVTTLYLYPVEIVSGGKCKIWHKQSTHLEITVTRNATTCWDAWTCSSWNRSNKDVACAPPPFVWTSPYEKLGHSWEILFFDPFKIIVIFERKKSPPIRAPPPHEDLGGGLKWCVGSSI